MPMVETAAHNITYLIERPIIQNGLFTCSMQIFEIAYSRLFARVVQ